jgi:hypothetical protein
MGTKFGSIVALSGLKTERYDPPFAITQSHGKPLGKHFDPQCSEAIKLISE